MRTFRRVLNILLIIAVAGVIAFWAYLLNQDFQRLPSDTVSRMYAVFNIKVLLFALFLIASITVVYYLNSLMDRKNPQDGPPGGGPGGGDRASDSTRQLEAVTVKILDRVEEIRKDLRRPAEPETKKHAGENQGEEKALKRIEPALKLLETRTVGELFARTTEIASEVMGARRVSIFLYGRENNKLYSVRTLGNYPSSGAAGSGERGPIETDDGISWYAFQQGKRLYATNIETHPEIARKNKPQYATKSLIVIPLTIFGEEKVGVLNLTEKSGEGGSFSKTDLEIASLIGTYFESRLENFILTDSVDELVKNLPSGS